VPFFNLQSPQRPSVRAYRVYRASIIPLAQAPTPIDATQITCFDDYPAISDFSWGPSHLRRLKRTCSQPCRDLIIYSISSASDLMRAAERTSQLHRNCSSSSFFSSTLLSRARISCTWLRIPCLSLLESVYLPQSQPRLVRPLTPLSPSTFTPRSSDKAQSFQSCRMTYTLVSLVAPPTYFCLPWRLHAPALPSFNCCSLA